MPGPGAHLCYTLGVGTALSLLTAGSFGPHHCLCYAINAFTGPDLGSFAEWLASHASGGSGQLGSLAMNLIHDPFFYPLLLGLPFSFLYSSLSFRLLRAGLLDSPSGVGLSRKQCLLLIFAGSLSHFFLDHLFEENGHSAMYTWILSTGWWEGTAPINTDSVVVIGLLCSLLLAGFVYINRVRSGRSGSRQWKSLGLVAAVSTAYCLWCASQTYLVNPRRPAIGEEADLGVLVFLAIYFFLPHSLCILSVNRKLDHTAFHASSSSLSEELPR